MDFSEGKFEGLHATRVLVEQVAQVRRGTPRVVIVKSMAEQPLCVSRLGHSVTRTHDALS